MKALRLATSMMGCAALVFSMLPGCSVNPTTGEKFFTGGMTENKEISIGRRQHPQIIKAFGGEYDSPTLKRYIDGIGQLLVHTTERRNFKYTFTILNTGIVNAFALPGGYIYISRGLLALAEDEAEVAGVLAHELGHVNALHHGRRQGNELLANILVSGVGIATRQMGVNPRYIDPINHGFQTLQQGVLRSYSRGHELESDRLAFRYMTRAGYDPQAMVGFLKKMRGQSKLEAKRLGKSPDEVDKTQYLATHPAPIERIRIARKLAGQYRLKEPMRARRIYLKNINGMIYGNDPKQGFVQGRVFAHPKLRIRFEVPREFRLFNSPSQVRAVGPDNAKIIFDSARKPSDGPVRFYLKDVWAAGLNLRQLETINISGLEAATATTRVRTISGSRDIRFLAIRKNLHTIYRFNFITKPGQMSRWSIPFRRTSHSFRILSEAEAIALKPSRIKLIRIQSGDTAAGIARRMYGDDGFSLERFRLINGLSVNARLRTGQTVKIITQ